MTIFKDWCLEMPRDGNLGFDGRMFLHESEWLTYCRRKPVRYTHKQKAAACEVCGLAESPENKFQNAHLIGFEFGVIHLGLTPQFLDDDANILTAHTKKCNRKAELNEHDSMLRLRKLGVVELPSYLPDAIRKKWSALAST